MPEVYVSDGTLGTNIASLGADRNSTNKTTSQLDHKGLQKVLLKSVQANKEQHWSRHAVRHSDTSLPGRQPRCLE